MISRKSKKGDLESKRGLYTIIGLLVVLGLVVSAFELFAIQDNSKDVGIQDEEVVNVLDEDVIATDPPPPPPPPPAEIQEAVLKQVEDDVEVEVEFDFSQDFDQNEVIEYEPIEIIETEVEEAPIHRFVEDQPEFPGGFEAFIAFLNKTLVYPEVPRQANIQGTVQLEFVVETDGSVSGIKVLAPLYPDCDNEAIRALKASPKWKPGKQNGKAVRCYYTIPVTFSLN